MHDDVAAANGVAERTDVTNVAGDCFDAIAFRIVERGDVEGDDGMATFEEVPRQIDAKKPAPPVMKTGLEVILSERHTG